MSSERSVLMTAVMSDLAVSCPTAECRGVSLRVSRVSPSAQNMASVGMRSTSVAEKGGRASRLGGLLV